MKVDLSARFLMEFNLGLILLHTYMTLVNQTTFCNNMLFLNFNHYASLIKI